MTREMVRPSEDRLPDFQAAEGAVAEAWSGQEGDLKPEGVTSAAVTSKHLPEVELTDSQRSLHGLKMREDGQVEFANSKGSVSCPVPESRSYGQFLFFRTTSAERGKPEDIAGVCKDAVDQYQKLESADQAYELASKIPDKNLAKAVTFSIFEKELQRAGLTLKDIAYNEVMANDFRPIAELTSEERQRRIEANERRINFKKALREEEAKPSEEITAEEAERRQKQLSQYLSEIGVTEERIKINQQVYVPLGWDLRRMRAAIPEASRSAGESSSLVVPQDHVYVSTNISTAGGKIKTEYVSAVDQSLNRVGVDLSLGGYPVVGFGGGKWRQEAEPAPEVEKAIRSSLVDQMDAEVWQQSQGTKHERAIEQVILQRRDLQ
ncbi:MAG TPA: hypothetical protein PLI59_01685 [Candidatus Obscuribacter sp.]|nr:hypothetical protein [Candidatus Obscuribacter sp.]HMX45373.1 hypothetical protein [Candidatus Obscuribacter sp.]HMY51953.1 hypothetical protein [Candidatus Obscuribacter sp.]HND07019.1 hypothetical protein [Candidatus Obscuribacter sp.]HNG17854.1 hypothetical protein [Candidatus Obscuribacter sp.]